MAAKNKASGSTTRTTATARPGKDHSASLARRVAEAAAGLRNGRRVWFVVEEKPRHRLRKHYDEAAADADVANSPGYIKVGPYLTPDETPHKRPVEQVRIKLKDQVTEVVYRGEDVDALFFSLAALEKFVYPYYTLVYGPDRAAEMRKNYVEASNKFAIFCHEPLSDECNPPPPPPCPPDC